MELAVIDWAVIVLFFVVSLLIGVIIAKKAGASSADFFLSGRNMPWWLLGVSMVATTFSADTPNLVTDIVRKDGVSGNWGWWVFLLTGMLTVFVYSRLWRRSEVMTDLEFYELRYSGKAAAFLRGFRAIYLGVFFNVMIMATVSLAAIKLGSVLLGLTAIETLLAASIVTVIYSSLGGLKGVLITDFFQFFIAMVGSVWACSVIVNLPEVGGLSSLVTNEAIVPKLDFLPDFTNTEALIMVFIIPIAVQWWSVWYPGSEPGGGGYIAQRMLSAKDEKNALGATLLFNVAHYALRPWPWILIALASILVFPDLESIKQAFPHVDPKLVNDDMAYPAMLRYLPTGLLGIVIASLIAAFMSTLSTHLNWGSSYIVNDFYKRFVKPEASEKEQVMVGRVSTVVLMLLSACLALFLDSAVQAFNILLSIGAGTGLIFILRWFWWRINAFTEIAGMVISLLVAIYFEVLHARLGFEPIEDAYRLVLSVAVTTAVWLLVTFLTRPTDSKVLKNFYEKIKPASIGWKTFIKQEEAKGVRVDASNSKENLANEILAMVIGCVGVYAALFGLGSLLYGRTTAAILLFLLAGISTYALLKVWKKLKITKA
ncbi:sodium:solute symporter family protein [Roseivirga pacifica]|uniref:sodium:solute symporter family protein n=1 Tax=Roseivirga pacifica TaxID=1267423 RepID=UPI00209447B2|nr:sodium:solute symporter family protein [Roseivirga pacifica]MCO6357987.1 Na+:solute symporter [Roseivirga pacifica]MCO6366426.1 Na+:solute symporter [Roseivirga pacifica]MCO6370911.1 Na+:solute symporter [Roseivirga pacifica]MCO6373719.1 Na+:solute symporter [Roseivirga pacifica]MCO6380700.1 Na+:solute symporter [Roseivirga pacifica]